MHIVFISDHETSGGAAIAASRLAEGLLAAGQRVTRIVAFPAVGPQPWATVRLAPRLFLARRATRSRLAPGPREQLDATAQPAIERELARLLADLRPEIVHLHNLHGGTGAGWSPALARVASQAAPTVWTLHDMWSFTGRCVYSGDCRRFLVGCDADCPTAGEYPALAPQRVAPAYADRRQLLNDSARLTAITPSRWLADEARSGLWRDRRVAVIPNGIDLGVYRPHAQAAARQALGLPLDLPVVLVVSPDLNDKRKGGHMLRAMLPALRRAVNLVTVGAGVLAPPPAPARLLSLGYLADDAQKALAYSAADLLLHPAPQDNLPNVVLEALACGTPVVALASGGLPELVRPGRTGWLADELSAVGLLQALETALDAIAAGQSLRASCRAVAEAEYGLARFTDRHIGLYRELIV